ncbi:unnamed protein product [Sphenostylis stenocarpa]|uniref:Uncharacterized protein n=1 Tax=Sphenostylis stenocarpa TaxID=92480 RepID=A0AA86SVN8_9FABA|nr:unnamed protein product [Sphenostylis stenocarpa]
MWTRGAGYAVMGGSHSLKYRETCDLNPGVDLEVEPGKRRWDNTGSTVQLPAKKRAINSSLEEVHLGQQHLILNGCLVKWSRGLMDKALASGAGDCGFESHRDLSDYVDGDMYIVIQSADE